MRLILPPEQLRGGLAGTEQLVEKITELIREGGKRASVRDKARRVAALARPQDATAEIQAVWDYLTGIGAPPYRMDPVDVQLLTLPENFDALGGVDCKKFTIAAGALLEALGHPVKVRVVDQNPQNPTRDANYHHVYLMVWNRDQGRWVVFDPVVKSFRHPSANVGSELRHQARRTYMIRRATPVRDGQIVRGNAIGFDFYQDVLRPFDFTRQDNKDSALAQATKAFLPDFAVKATEAHAAAVKATAPAVTKANQPTPPPKMPALANKPAQTLTAQAKAALAKRGKAVTNVQKLESAPPKKEGLSTGAKVAIGVGVAAVAVATTIAIVKAFKKKRRKNPRRARRSKRRAAA